ncbi:CRISPR-associated endonuclease Cas1, partial [Parafrankia colletiae]|uniref:CRISPR-associated endonuclease Cas1 n=1 Tax=Parafrankia colletiae TaxID=573497 RepID=UPI00104224DD
MTVAPVLVAEENATRTAEVQRTLETIYADTDTGQVVAISDGFGVSVAVKDNRLSVGDGIGQHRRTRRWERADRKLKRLIVTGAGSVSLDALSWCADVGVCVVTLDRHARVTGVMVQGTDDARLRRSQALATADSVRAAELLRPLLKAKQAPSNGGTHWSSRSMAKASG